MELRGNSVVAGASVGNTRLVYPDAVATVGAVVAPADASDRARAWRGADS